MVVKKGKTKHWILLVKNNTREMFQVLDSLWELSTYRDQIDKMVRYSYRDINIVLLVHYLGSRICLRANCDFIEVQIMGINSILSVSTPKTDVSSWDVIQEGDISQQKDGYVIVLPAQGFIFFTNKFLYFG